MNPLSADQVKKMSYADFIGIMSLENVSLAGGFTVDYWVSKACINKKSRVLEIACSTGFNIRNCVFKTGASGVGVDVSQNSIESAREKSHLHKKIQFKVGNAEHLRFASNSFTHVISGMGFSFIKGRDKALKEVARVLLPRGRLLTATSYYKMKPTVDLLNKVEKVFSFRPLPSWNYDWWFDFFSQFFTLKHEVSVVKAVTPMNYEKLKKSVSEYVLNGNHRMKNYSPEVKKACIERLVEIHLTLNENTRCQTGNLQVWELRSLV